MAKHGSPTTTLGLRLRLQATSMVRFEGEGASAERDARAPPSLKPSTRKPQNLKKPELWETQTKKKNHELHSQTPREEPGREEGEGRGGKGPKTIQRARDAFAMKVLV